MSDILLLNGPNLNMLGSREAVHYGQTSLAEITDTLSDQAKARKHSLSHFQSNAEHELVERVQRAANQDVGAIILNPGAYTHTSIALRDALLGSAIPFIEVHLSNVYQRETFRHRSYFSDIAAGTIIGLGALGYELALAAAIDIVAGRT